MTKKDKEMLLFYLNDKANSATKMRYDIIDQESNTAYFHKGCYSAFKEMYSLVSNIHTDDEE